MDWSVNSLNTPPSIGNTLIYSAPGTSSAMLTDVLSSLNTVTVCRLSNTSFLFSVSIKGIGHEVLSQP